MLGHNQNFSFSDNLFIENAKKRKILGPEALRALPLFNGLCQMFCSSIALRGHNDPIIQIMLYHGHALLQEKKSDEEQVKEKDDSKETPAKSAPEKQGFQRFLTGSVQEDYFEDKEGLAILRELFERIAIKAHPISVISHLEKISRAISSSLTYAPELYDNKTSLLETDNKIKRSMLFGILRKAKENQYIQLNFAKKPGIKNKFVMHEKGHATLIFKSEGYYYFFDPQVRFFCSEDFHKLCDMIDHSIEKIYPKESINVGIIDLLAYFKKYKGEAWIASIKKPTPENLNNQKEWLVKQVHLCAWDQDYRLMGEIMRAFPEIDFWNSKDKTKTLDKNKTLSEDVLDKLEISIRYNDSCNIKSMEKYIPELFQHIITRMQDAEGKTALMYFCSTKKDFPGMIEKMIELKADILHCDQTGKRAIQYAVAKGNLDAAKYLRDIGDQTNILNELWERYNFMFKNNFAREKFQEYFPKEFNQLLVLAAKPKNFKVMMDLMQLGADEKMIVADDKNIEKSLLRCRLLTSFEEKDNESYRFIALNTLFKLPDATFEKILADFKTLDNLISAHLKNEPSWTIEEREEDPIRYYIDFIDEPSEINNIIKQFQQDREKVSFASPTPYSKDSNSPTFFNKDIPDATEDLSGVLKKNLKQG